MRVLLIDGAPFFGGQTRHVYDLALGLIGRGHEVAVSCNHQDFHKLLRASDIPTVQTSFRHWPNPAAVAAICRAAKELEVDVIHTHGVRGGMTGRVAAKLAGCRRVVHTVHTMPEDMFKKDSPVYGAKRSAYRTMDRALSRVTDSIITVSDDLYRRMIALGVPENKLTVIHSGADVSRYECALNKSAARKKLDIPDGCRVVGTVARFTRQKNLTDLLRAAKVVASKRPDVVFALVGDGEETSILKRAACDLGIAHKIYFTGFRPDVASVMSAFDVFAMSSLWEGHSLAVIEAMAAGLPVVATDVAGVRETITDGVTGCVVPPKDPDRLAAAIERVLASGDRGAMGAAGRARARALFGLDRMISQVENTYKSGLDRRASSVAAEVLRYVDKRKRGIDAVHPKKKTV